MKKITIELDETTCKWLEHIADLTNQPIEKVIADGIYNKIAVYEDRIYKDFVYSEHLQG